MTDENEDKKDYKPEVYIIAGFSTIFSAMSAEDVKKLTREVDFQGIFEAEFGRGLSDEITTATLDLLRDLNLLVIDDDEYAGRYVTVQKTAFSSRLKEVAVHLPGSAIDIVQRAGRPWLEVVYAQPNFWQNLQEEVLSHRSGIQSTDVEDSVPASDRTVTLLHNSEERAEVETGLEVISETLRTNNQIAAELGEDRERISAEIDSVKAGIKSEKIRADYISNTVLKILRELGLKLKDKAADIGIDRLILLFEKILDNFF